MTRARDLAHLVSSRTMNLNNTLANNNPISKSDLAELVKETIAEAETPEQGVSDFINKIKENPASNGYKFLVSATELPHPVSGPVKNYVGANWNPETDGSWVFVVQKPNQQLVLVVNWIRS